MHLSLGKFHVAVYLDGSSQNPLLNPEAEETAPHSLQHAFDQQRRFEAVDTDRRRWVWSDPAALGRRL
jgi:hypothetical protein